MKKQYMIFLLLVIVVIGVVLAYRADKLPMVQDQADETPTIKVVSAIYGGNCANVNTEKANVTSHLAQACDGKTSCKYSIRASLIGDPARMCKKEYTAEWSCGTDSATLKKTVASEAAGRDLVFTCEQQAKAAATAPAQ